MTGQEIRNRRQALNMTQAEFADALGITANAVALWERGERTPATPRMLDMALCWLESQQPKSARHKSTMCRINATINDSRAVLGKRGEQ